MFLINFYFFFYKERDYFITIQKKFYTGHCFSKNYSITYIFIFKLCKYSYYFILELKPTRPYTVTGQKRRRRHTVEVLIFTDDQTIHDKSTISDF